jgi:hypothetical protein
MGPVLWVDAVEGGPVPEPGEGVLLQLDYDETIYEAVCTAPADFGFEISDYEDGDPIEVDLSTVSRWGRLLPTPELLLPTDRGGLRLAHNPQLASERSVSSWIEDNPWHRWQDSAAKDRSIALGEVWELVWFPTAGEAPLAAAAPTLGELLGLVASEGEQPPAPGSSA